MKICVCGDTHGNSDGIKDMLKLERPRMMIFLGDGLRDLAWADVPESITVVSVRGNCDLGFDGIEQRVVEIGGRRIFVTHGHNLYVKQGLDSLALAAKEEKSNIALYGHTHRAGVRDVMGVTTINPGALKSEERKYAVMEIDEKGVSWFMRAL